VGKRAQADPADPRLDNPAFLSCWDAVYYLRGWPLTAAVLVDARHPGRAPPALPGMKPIPGHPTLLNANGGLQDGLSARRLRSAWLIVRGGRNVTQRLALLHAVRSVTLRISGRH
jgi:hypothetical protein